MGEAGYARCGMRCDLCLIWRPNVEKEDRREAVCAAWRKMWACVLEKGLEHCGCCEQYPCGIFPAEPSDEEVRRKIEVEKLWTWEDEKLMEAYACRKHMDEFRERQ